MSQGPTNHKFVLVTPTESKPRRVRGTTACTRCHRLKVKCIPSPNGEACARCAKTPQALECSIRIANIMSGSFTSPESTSSSIDSSPIQQDSGQLVSEVGYDSCLTSYPVENYVDPSGRTHETFMYVPGGVTESVMHPGYSSHSNYISSSQYPQSTPYSPSSSAYSSGSQYSSTWEMDADVKPYLTPESSGDRMDYIGYPTQISSQNPPSTYSPPLNSNSKWQSSSYHYQ